MIWWIYLIGVADKVQMLNVVALVFFSIYAIGFFVALEFHDDAPDFLKSKYPLVLFMLSMLLLTLAPSSKTLAAMYVLPKIAENQEMKTEAREILDLAKDWLKKESEQ